MMSEQITVVIFGASGDLTQRKLVPALYSQFVKGRLPPEVRVVGTSRSEISDDEFRARMQTGASTFVPEQYDDAKWAEFAERITYVAADAAYPQGMDKVQAALDACAADVENRLYYLSVAPKRYAPSVEQLGAQGMANEAGGWRRIVV